MAKILACDLDGTLFYPKQRKRFISKKNLAFLRDFIDKGNRLVLVTSRSEAFCYKVIKEIDRPVDFLASLGAICYVDGGIVVRKTIDNVILKEAIDEIIKKLKPLGMVLGSSKYDLLLGSPRKISKFYQFILKRWYSTFGIYRERFEFDSDLFFRELEEGEIYQSKIFFGFSKKKNKINKDLNKYIRDNYPEIEASWVGIAIEITAKGCNKAKAIEDYARYVGIDHENVYVIGDSGNDISMFNAFHEHSFCMSHGFPSVKKYASHEVTRVYKLSKYLFAKEE